MDSTVAARPQAEQDRIRRLTGRGLYTADERHEATAHAAFLRSPHAHASLLTIDISAARTMPGVLAVLTGADCIAAGLQNFPVIDRIGKGLIIPHRPVLAHDRVRHVGEAVAMVVAETLAQAMDACEAIFIEYDMLPATIGLDAAEAAGAALVHAGTPGNLALRHAVGDPAEIEAALAASAHVVETSIEMPRLTPFTLEPRAALGVWDEDAQRYLLRVPHQGVNEIRRDLAGVLGLPPDRFLVLGGDVGGGFGPRNAAYPEYIGVLLAAKLILRPVAWNGSRSESFLTDTHGRGVRVKGRLGIDADGRFTALEMDYVADLGAYISCVAVFAAIYNPLQSLIGCYAIPQACAELRVVHTHSVPTGPYRGAGRPEMSLLIERLVDIAARRLGVDPLELREKNAIPPEAFPYTLPASGARYDSGNFPALIARAREIADWHGFAARKAEAAKRGVRLGRGCTLFIEVSGGGGLPDEAKLTLSALGGKPLLQIETVTGATGQSHPRTFANIAAHRLGLSETQTLLVASDPHSTLVGMGSYASRSTIAAGNAVARAADEIADQIKRRAGLRANLPPEELTLRGAAVFRPDGSAVCQLTALLDTPIAVLGKQPPSNAYPSGCHIAELELDPETGVATLVRYVAVDDCGVAVDHPAMEAQVHGGIAQGVGEVLSEEATYDETGQLLAASLMDYALPRADSLPSYQLADCNTPSPFNPLGVKGVGEAGTTGALCVVTSAVEDALGGRALPRMPFTPLRLWQALNAPPVAE